MQWFTLHSCIRHFGESVSTFIAELRKLLEHWDFGATLNDMLRDRLVCGINDKRIQRHLLTDSDLKAKQLAQASETADQNARDMEKVNSTRMIKISDKEGGAFPLQTAHCYRRHQANKCCFYDSICHHCGKKGHISKACHTKQHSERS